MITLGFASISEYMLTLSPLLLERKYWPTGETHLSPLSVPLSRWSRVVYGFCSSRDLLICQSKCLKTLGSLESPKRKTSQPFLSLLLPGFPVQIFVRHLNDDFVFVVTVNVVTVTVINCATIDILTYIELTAYLFMHCGQNSLHLSTLEFMMWLSSIMDMCIYLLPFHYLCTACDVAFYCLLRARVLM